MSACLTCGCKQLVANQFQPDKCATCLHNHSRNITPTPATASGSPITPPRTPPPPPTRKVPTPRASPHGSPAPKRRDPSPTPRKKEESGMWDKMKGDFLEIKDQVVDKVGGLSRSSSTPDTTREVSVQRVEEKKPASKEQKPSVLTKSVSRLKDMKDSAFGGDKDVEISGPRGFKHQGHMGLGKDGGFEVRNLPPEMNHLLRGLDGELKRMGQKGITKKEARMLYNAARRSQMPGKPPAGLSPDNPPSPGRESVTGKPLPPPPKKDLPSVPSPRSAATAKEPRPASPRPGGPPSRPSPSGSSDADQRRIRALEDAKLTAEKQANSSASEVARLKKELAEEKRSRQEAEDSARRSQEQLEELRLRAATAPGSAATKGLEMQLQELRKKTAQETESLRQRLEEEGKKKRAAEERCKELERENKAGRGPSAEDQAALRKRHEDEMAMVRNRMNQEVEEATKRWEAEIKARLALQESLRKAEEELLRAHAGAGAAGQNIEKEIAAVKAKLSADADAMRKKAEEERTAAENERKVRRQVEQERDDAKRKLADVEAAAKEAKASLSAALSDSKTTQSEYEAASRKADEERNARSKEESLRRALELEVAELKTKIASNKSGDDERRYLEAEVAALKTKLNSAHDGQRKREEEEAAKRKAAEEELRLAQVEIADMKARLATAEEARRALEAEVSDARTQAREAASQAVLLPTPAPPPPPMKAPPPPPKAPKAPAPPPASPNKAAAPAAPSGQSALLAAIANPENNKMLKHVSIQVKDTKAGDENSMLNILARALIERRTNMNEQEDDDEDSEGAEEGDDEELDWED